VPEDWTAKPKKKRPKVKKAIDKKAAKGAKGKNGKANAKPAPNGTSSAGRASAFELFLPEFKKTDAARECKDPATGEAFLPTQKAERVKVVRALARSKWDVMSPEEKAPYETKSKEAREAKAKEVEKETKVKAPRVDIEDPVAIEYRRCLALPADTGDSPPNQKKKLAHPLRITFSSPT